MKRIRMNPLPLTTQQILFSMAGVMAALSLVAPATADTADFSAITGDAAGAVAVGPVAAVFYATNLNHTTYLPSQLPGTTQNLNGVAHNDNGTYFAVGGNGLVLRSTGANGSAFSAETAIPVTAELFAVAKWPTLIVAAGEGGALIRSTSINGGGWVSIATGVDAALHDLTYGLTTGVAVGDVGTVLWSDVTAGVWTAVTPSPASSSDLRGVARLADNRFIAVGSGGTVIIGTANGQQWSAATFSHSVELNDVAVKTASPSRQVAVADGGRIFYSSNNGADWFEAGSPVVRDLHGVVYTGTDWLIAGDHGTLLRSTDGITWIDNTAVEKRSWGKMKKMWTK
jgi:photosystem II stability/assembly factor-like uncharacterized protein